MKYFISLVLLFIATFTSGRLRPILLNSLRALVDYFTAIFHDIRVKDKFYVDHRRGAHKSTQKLRAPLLTILFSGTLLCNAFQVQAQSEGDYDPYVNSYDTSWSNMTFIVDSVPLEFETVFSSDAENNFKLLRKFRSEKAVQHAQMNETNENLKARISSLGWERDYKLQELKDDESELNDLTVAISELSKADPHLSYLIRWRYETYFTDDGNVIANQKELLKSQLNDSKSDKENAVQTSRQGLNDLDVMLQSLKKSQKLAMGNLSRIKEDIDACEYTIDEALAPEKADQSFKLWITGAFVIIIAALIIAFFIVIYRKSEARITVKLLSDGGLQFITVFVLIIAIVLFGVLGILHAKELAAILSGIAGYILGRSSSDKLNAPEPAAVQKNQVQV